MGTFSGQISIWCNNTLDAIENGVRQVARDAFNNCVNNSPVYTGRYRSSWRIGLDSIDPSTEVELPQSQSKNPVSAANAIQQAESALKQFKVGQTIYLSNSVPYAEAIELGTVSPLKAPRGVLIVSLEQTIQQYT